MLVGNNLGCKCSFASKEMLFSELDEQAKKKKTDLFSPDSDKHHL